ncbi:DUF6234 family protein [Streptomyces sp. NRRL S-237]|uniref:DUF6234 family protein n=1 Tax=Streptomyces sp. NRRL S-237 TaxID=1463895 RepID=UPI00068977C5|nr:DUF6234 family protein [Streptomyces sp. NRRL S-237]
MITSSVEPRRRRDRRPWSRRTPRAADLAIAILLLLFGAAWLVSAALDHGVEIEAAQGHLDRIEAADLAHMARLQEFLVVVLVVAVLALVSRAPWTMLSQVLAATLAGVALTGAQHSWDRSHPGSTGSASEGAVSRYRESNAFRIPGEMSPESAQDAQREADRVEPVLKRLPGKRDMGSEERA